MNDGVSVMQQIGMGRGKGRKGEGRRGEERRGEKRTETIILSSEQERKKKMRVGSMSRRIKNVMRRRIKNMMRGNIRKYSPFPLPSLKPGQEKNDKEKEKGVNSQSNPHKTPSPPSPTQAKTLQAASFPCTKAG